MMSSRQSPASVDDERSSIYCFMELPKLFGRFLSSLHYARNDLVLYFYISIGYYPHFLMEIYSVLFEDFFFYQIAESEDILPGCLGIVDEEVAMLFAHLHSSDASSLQPCMIDESTR
jgi:hypothetical protein